MTRSDDIGKRVVRNNLREDATADTPLDSRAAVEFRRRTERDIARIIDQETGCDGIDASRLYVIADACADEIPRYAGGASPTRADMRAAMIAHFTPLLIQATEAEKPMHRPDCQMACEVYELCRHRGWSMHWTARGCYGHLEWSELIEAVRGKAGDPLEEAGDVLTVLMSVTCNEGMPWHSVVDAARDKIKEMMKTKIEPDVGEFTEIQSDRPTTPDPGFVIIKDVGGKRHYWTGVVFGGAMFTDDYDKAVRFAREQDAETMRINHLKGETTHVGEAYPF